MKMKNKKKIWKCVTLTQFKRNWFETRYTRSNINKISSDTCMKTARLLPTFHHHWNAWRTSSQKRCFVSKIIYLYLNTLYFFHRFAEKFYNKFCWKNFVQIVHIFFRLYMIYFCIPSSVFEIVTMQLPCFMICLERLLMCWVHTWNKKSMKIIAVVTEKMIFLSSDMFRFLNLKDSSQIYDQSSPI